MIGWFLWFFLAPYLFLLDGLLMAWLPLRVDVVAAVCLVLGLFVRTRALPGLLLFAALGRALLVDGDVALHFLGMGLPIAALLPLRAAFFERSVLFQAGAAAFLALTVPRVTALFADLSAQPADPVVGGLDTLLFAALVVPPLAWALRRAPPLSLFVERGR